MAASSGDSSPLSSRASSEFGGYNDDDSIMHDAPMDDTEMPPSKRPKLSGHGAGSTASSTIGAGHLEEDEDDNQAPDPLEDIDISSDSSGDIPVTPTINHIGGGGSRLDDEDEKEQVTVCAWDGCEAGDLQNMDRLVKHIHNAHIEGRQKKYTCEWVGCPRQSLAHASGYALKAHMRSHTKEKPFYCYLPECDRSFTRSDALAKHMRTVHETEALRPSDPVPKSMQNDGLNQTAATATSKPGSKLKIVIKTPQTAQEDAMDDVDSGDESIAANFTQLSSQDGFEPEELDMPLERLHILCRKQVQWAEEERDVLAEHCKKWEETYKSAWLEKEVLVEQMEKAETAWGKKRDARLAREAPPANMTNGDAPTTTNGAGASKSITPGHAIEVGDGD